MIYLYLLSQGSKIKGDYECAIGMNEVASYDAVSSCGAWRTGES